MILSEWLGVIRKLEGTCGWGVHVIVVWTRCISWLRRPRLYPRLLRYCYCACVHSLQRSLNVSLEEYIRRILRARLNGKARLVCRGWHDECKSYSCSAVGLVKRTISMIDTVIEGHLDVEKGERFEWAVWYKFNSGMKGIFGKRWNNTLLVLSSRFKTIPLVSFRRPLTSRKSRSDSWTSCFGNRKQCSIVCTVIDNSSRPIHGWEIAQSL